MKGRFEIQYRRADGQWWIGHHGTDLKDPAAYAAGLNKRNDTVARVVDKVDGTIYGQPGCSLCGAAHEGVDGSCLL